jgi:hypothetical protein
LEYGAVIWDPYERGEIDKLERVQRQAARFISGNYRNREEGYITNLPSDLDLPALQHLRKALRLMFLYKVVEGLVPAIPSDKFTQKQRPKRRIRAKRYSDHQTHNIVERQVINNTKGLVHTHDSL